MFFDRLKNIFFTLCVSKNYALKKMGVTIGKNCNIAINVQVGSEPYLITIGDNVQITSGVKIFTHGGGWILRKFIPDFDSFGKVKIGNNVYIGNNALIMPGVIIEDNVLIGAGSVVTKSIPSGYIVAGNPAKIVGDIESYAKRSERHNFKTKGLHDKEKKHIIMNSDESLFIVKKYLEK